MRCQCPLWLRPPVALETGRGRLLCRNRLARVALVACLIEADRRPTPAAFTARRVARGPFRDLPSRTSSGKERTRLVSKRRAFVKQAKRGRTSVMHPSVEVHERVEFGASSARQPASSPLSHQTSARSVPLCSIRKIPSNNSHPVSRRHCSACGPMAFAESTPHDMDWEG